MTLILHWFACQLGCVCSSGVAANLAIIIPTSMAGTKISVPLAANGTDVKAGPGQKPPKPQPAPTKPTTVTKNCIPETSNEPRQFRDSMSSSHFGFVGFLSSVSVMIFARPVRRMLTSDESDPTVLMKKTTRPRGMRCLTTFLG